MIKQEYFKTRKDGVKIYRTYSDNNKYIKQLLNGKETGFEDTQAFDVYPVKYTYIETEKDIPTTEENNI